MNKEVLAGAFGESQSEPRLIHTREMDWNCLFARRTVHMKRTAVRELLKVTGRPEIISFAGGLPAAELFPVPRVQQAVDSVLRRLGGQSLQYAETEGIPELRDWLAARFSNENCRIGRENVLVTSGGQQALDLLGRILLDEGDAVAVENPTYLALLSAWRPLGVRYVPIPSDQAGLDVDALAKLLSNGARSPEPGSSPPVKVIYLVPNFQNPQGTTLTRPRREKLTRLLRKHDVALVEDNPYGELRYSGRPLPNLLELDAASTSGGGLDTHVIYTGTFSKVLMPGLRVGWVVAARPVIEKLVQAKQAADLHTSTFCQHVAFELVRNGFLEEFLPALRDAYRERRDRMLAALEEHFAGKATWTQPDGGMFLLLTLAPGLDASRLLPEALRQGVAFVPGEEFHLNGAGRNTLRLNFSNAKPGEIDLGLERLAQVISLAQ